MLKNRWNFSFSLTVSALAVIPQFHHWSVILISVWHAQRFSLFSPQSKCFCDTRQINLPKIKDRLLSGGAAGERHNLKTPGGDTERNWSGRQMWKCFALISWPVCLLRQPPTPPQERGPPSEDAPVLIHQLLRWIVVTLLCRSNRQLV